MDEFEYTISLEHIRNNNNIAELRNIIKELIKENVYNDRKKIRLLIEANNKFNKLSKKQLAVSIEEEIDEVYRYWLIYELHLPYTTNNELITYEEFTDIIERIPKNIIQSTHYTTYGILSLSKIYGTNPVPVDINLLRIRASNFLSSILTKPIISETMIYVGNTSVTMSQNVIVELLMLKSKLKDESPETTFVAAVIDHKYTFKSKLDLIDRLAIYKEFIETQYKLLDKIETTLLSKDFTHE